MCVDSGLVAGHTQAVDSAYIKANASLDSLEIKKPLESLKDHIEKIREENDNEQDPPVRRRAKTDRSTQKQKSMDSTKHQLKDLNTHQKWFSSRKGGALGSKNPRARYLSNKTHYSPVDPDARIAVKPGKPRQLYYMSSMSVDTFHHVITHIRANHADKKDSMYLIDMVRQTQSRLQ